MKVNKVKNLFKPLFFMLVLIFASTFLMPTTKNSAKALYGYLEISGNSIINTKENVISATFHARLVGSENFRSEDISWYLNNVILAENYEQGKTTNSSTIHLSSHHYSSLPSNTFITISARIIVNGQVHYQTDKQVMVFTPKDNDFVISANNTTLSYNENNDYKFIFTSTKPNAKWFLLEDYGKYTPLNIQAHTNEYHLNVENSGTYTVMAQLDGKTSNVLSVEVLYPFITEMTLKEEIIGKNNLGLNIYKFYLESVDESHDIANINWYRRGYESTPLQYGGNTFIFEPTSYSKYEIYARYEGASTMTTEPSNIVSKDIKIDRTKDILIFFTTIFVIMSAGLIVLIRRNIKKDKIW